jgi:hypothetical protein
LTALRHLELKGITRLNASLLSGMAQLTRLQLQMSCNDFKDSCMEKMLRALRQMQQLQQLQHLELEFDSNYGDRHVPDVSHRLCNALTSSSHLTHLTLQGVQLPSDSAGRLFSVRLPHLKTFKLDANNCCRYYGRPVDEPQPRPFGQNMDVRSLGVNCPSLCELDFAGAVQEGVDLGALRLLTGLTSLVVGGHCVDDACARRLAQLSCLNSLTILKPATKPANAVCAERCGYGIRCDRYGDVGGYEAGYGSADSGRGGRGMGGPGYSDNVYGYTRDYNKGRGHGPGCERGHDYGRMSGSFTVGGLCSLMQLTSLSTFAISTGTCLKDSRCSSSYDDDGLLCFTSLASRC